MIHELSVDEIPLEERFLQKKLSISKNIKNNIIIRNYYNSNTYIYIEKINKTLRIFDSPFLSKNEFFPEGKLDLFLRSKEIFFSHLISLPHGYEIYLKADDWERKRIDSQLTPSSKINPVIALDNALLKNIETANVAISFSGGLDSTSILYSAKKIFKNKNIVAFTWWGFGSALDDLKESRRICDELNIKLIEIEIYPEELFTEINLQKHSVLNYPTIYLAFIAFIEKYINILKKEFLNQKFTIIDGTGGDHIFLESINIKFVPFISSKKIYTYSKLTNTNILKVLKTYIKKKKSNERELREESIYEAACLTSSKYFVEEDCSFFFPFLTQDLIDCSLSYPITDSFNEYYTRLNFRNSFKKSYQTGNFFRFNKGVMTGVYQKSISNNLSLFLEWIEESSKNDNYSWDYKLLKKQLRLSSLGINGVPPYLMNFLLIHMVKKAKKRKNK